VNCCDSTVCEATLVYAQNNIRRHSLLVHLKRGVPVSVYSPCDVTWQADNPYVAIRFVKFVNLLLMPICAVSN